MNPPPIKKTISLTVPPGNPGSVFPDHPRNGRLLQGAVLLFCLFTVASRFWVAEDAYITFRVVDNLYAGHGLVYNPGERVEVFTHPLWIMALVVLRGIGIPLHPGSIALGFILVIVGLAFLIYRPDRNGRPEFPLAALALAAVSGFRDFATSGMEFAPAFLLLVLFFTELEQSALRERPSYFAGLLALLYLTRPELGLLLAYYSLFLAVGTLRELRSGTATPGQSVRHRTVGALRTMLAWGLPVILIAGSWHLFRAIYYGDLFPNTFYAKSGLGSYYSQGWKYLMHSFFFAPSIWFPLGTVIVFLLLPAFRRTLPAEERRGLYRELGAIALLIFYVVRLGGDFMSFRFLLPEMVMLAVTAQRILRQEQAIAILSEMKIPGMIKALLFRLPGRSWAAVLLFVALSFIPVPRSRGYIADERQVFVGETNPPLYRLVLGSDHPWSVAGRRYGRLQRCLELENFRITNSQYRARCMEGLGLGYFGVAAGAGVKILDEQGLTQREVARARVLARFRPGHEHSISFEQALQWGAIFCSTGEPVYDRIMSTPAGVIIRLDPELLALLPDIGERLRELRKWKDSGSAVIPRLERRYGVSVEKLSAQAGAWERDPLFRSRTSCWSDFARERQKK